MKKPREYTVIVEKQEDARGYSVRVSALAGCFSTGATVEDALQNVKDAIETYLDGLRELGEEMPIEDPKSITRKVKVAV